MKRIAMILYLVLVSLAAGAADFPAPKEGTWIVRDFKFHTGEVLPEVKSSMPDGLYQQAKAMLWAAPADLAAADALVQRYVAAVNATLNGAAR